MAPVFFDVQLGRRPEQPSIYQLHHLHRRIFSQIFLLLFLTLSLSLPHLFLTHLSPTLTHTLSLTLSLTASSFPFSLRQPSRAGVDNSGPEKGSNCFNINSENYFGLLVLDAFPLPSVSSSRFDHLLPQTSDRRFFFS